MDEHRTDRLLELLSQLLTERMRLREMRVQMQRHDSHFQDATTELNRLLDEIYTLAPPARPPSVLSGGLAQSTNQDDADSS